MNKENKKKSKKWLRFRHKVVRNIAYCLLSPYSKIKYGIKVEKFKDQGDRAYLVLYNHQTAFDQFFVGMAFKGPVYYVASEDLFSNGVVSSLIKYLVAPIPIKKSMTDVRAVIDCKRVAKEGGTIAIAPEGNRTFSGKTGYIKPAIAQLVKALRLPLVIYRLDGGFGVQPRWSDVTRKGKMLCYVSKVIEYEEYSSLSDDELYTLICNELEINESQIDRCFKHKKSAEYLERAMYYCPECGFSEWESHKDTITCKKCSTTVRYLPTKELEGVGKPFPYRFLSEWYKAQCDFVISSDLSEYKDKPIYQDFSKELLRVIPYKTKFKLASDIMFSVYNDRFTFEGNGYYQEIPFDHITAVSVLGRNKLNIYINGNIIQIRTKNKRFNALKYMNLYYHAANMMKGVIENDKLLGI